jgi:2-isopropylmalate synthase
MHQILDPVYPALQSVQLTDYRVRILTPHEGTNAVTRVMIESRDGTGDPWVTLGISEDIINASYQALTESYQYKLLKDGVVPLSV